MTAHGPVPARLSGPLVEGALWQASPDAFRLSVPGVARYHAGLGPGLTVDAEPGADPQLVARLAAMTPLAAWLYLHEHVALHAAAAAGPAGAVLVTGDSSAGKSTLVAALLQRGWRFVADDLAVVTVVDGAARVGGSGDRLWLCADAADRLGWRQPDEPTAVPWASGAEQVAAAPLRAVVWLGRRSGTEPAADRLSGVAAFDALVRACYNTQVADVLLDRGVLFRWAAAVGGAVPVWRLRRPRGRWSVAALADWVADLP